LKKIILLISSLASCAAVYGQTVVIKHVSRHKDYVKDFYKNHLIIRAYESSKFNSFKFIDGKDDVVYKPNHHNDVGLGFTYKIISVNCEFYVPVFGQNNNKYGVTHSFDVQTYAYVHRFVIDLLAQVYHGYYLSNVNGSVSSNLPPVVVRPDMATKNISLACQYVFNDEHFSFNAPFYQNEIQLKSAGSFLLGGGLYHNDGNADSSFIPSQINKADFFGDHRFNGYSYTSIAATGGYAYTQVIGKRFFITGALSAGCGIGYSSIAGDNMNRSSSKAGPEYIANGKFAAGYTNDKYFAGVTYVRVVTEINSVVPHTWQQDNMGNFRFTVAERFRLKKSLIPKSDVIKID